MVFDVDLDKKLFNLQKKTREENLRYQTSMRRKKDKPGIKFQKVDWKTFSYEKIPVREDLPHEGS